MLVLQCTFEFFRTLFSPACSCNRRRTEQQAVFIMKLTSSTRNFAFLLYLQLAFSALQFCEDKPSERSDFCIAINTFHNQSTTVDDWYVSISARFQKGKYGWLALGAGNYIMHRTLMFVMYPGTKEGSMYSRGLEMCPGRCVSMAAKLHAGVVFGPRSTQYHDEPKHTPDLPEIEIRRTGFTEGYHSVDFVCYGCNLWDSHALKPDAVSQPWIWATNPFTESESDDPNKNLQRHAFYGSMFMDMSASRVHDVSGNRDFPKISTDKSERVMISASYQAKNKETGNSTHSSYVIHGLMLTLAFGLLYPAGVVAALGGHRWASIKSHWVVQSLTATCALAGIAVGLYGSVARGGIGSLLGLHQAVGCLVGLALLTQGLLGCRHHAIYVKTRAPTNLKVYHVWLGRALYGLGSFNVVLGLLQHSKRWLAVGWIVLIIGQVFGYFIFLVHKTAENEKSKHEYTYAQVAGEEDSEVNIKV